ncbi:MAG: shikimate dehydrogenase [Armatimonadota bacterium]|nr:shikimate dehydrogenase [Armatimonadota bacterium]MCX7777979.1 shikimate dehydrogenase [Armatimonadota bacterium]MDW8026144.1 shikimate dehydrogenase [Armatimonadota bacterium]
MINASTKFIAVIGDPIEHSMTPVIQNAALEALGTNVRNIAFRVRREDFDKAVRGAMALGILGLMVTIPHKEAAASISDELDWLAQLTGSANLLHFRDGTIVGYNTDGYGASQSLKDAGVDVKGKRVAIVGAGGAGRCLCFQMLLDGASCVHLFNRTAEKAIRVVEEAKAKLSYENVYAHELKHEALKEVLKDVEILINATSVGMHPNENETPVPADCLHDGLVVFDIVYNPLETRLLREAKEVGAKVIDGVSMLVYTNVRAVEVCLKLTPSFELMRQRCIEELRRKI